jgi:Flp pilus assembly protein TadG
VTPPVDGRLHGERGSVALELALAVPIIVFALVLASLAWRLTTANGDVRRAAGEAARAGSLALTSVGAVQAARQTAEATLAGRGVTCRQLAVNVDTSDFRAGGTITVSVACTVDTSDITLLRIGGDRTLTGRAVEVVDTRRGGG